MIDKRLIIGQIENFHFSWMNGEFGKYFKEVVVTSNPWFPARKDDVLLANAALGSFQRMECRLKFGIMLPGFGFHPFKNPEQFEALKPTFARYDAVFCDEAPVWEAARRDGTCRNFHKVPICANSRDFRKTRKRSEFRRVLQVASHGSEKGRDVARKAMALMPYEWEQVPAEGREYFSVPQSEMPGVFQRADGFLHPGRVGDPPGYWTDAKYTVSLIEAGMSGCVVFWHDAMGVGNSMETVFEVSLDPAEIAERVKEVAGSIDLDAHSERTSREFTAKHSIENTVKAKMEVMSGFM